MNSNKTIRRFLNTISRIKYNEPYSKLGEIRARKVRKLSLRPNLTIRKIRSKR